MLINELQILDAKIYEYDYAKNQKNKSKGFCILEVVSAIFIFSIVTVAIYGSFTAGLKSLAQSKHRVAATELANEKMEIIRNMAYADIGTVGGVPSGTFRKMKQSAKAIRNSTCNCIFDIYDDSQDGIGNSMKIWSRRIIKK